MVKWRCATDKAVVEVKSGASLADPTVPMRREASAGLYKTEHGVFPRLQILTMEGLFEGARPHMPWIDPSVFHNARRQSTERQGDLGVYGAGPPNQGTPGGSRRESGGVSGPGRDRTGPANPACVRRARA